MNPAPKKYYSVKEVAKLLNVSTNTLYKYLDEGKIHSRRIGKGRFKIPQSELLPYLESEIGTKVEKTEKLQVGAIPKKRYIPSAIGDSSMESIQAVVKHAPIGSSAMVTFGVNDILIFRIFMALVFFGLGMIYIVGTPTNYALQTAHHTSISMLLMPILPYMLIVVGFFCFIESVFYGKTTINHLAVDLFATVVTGYYALVSLVAGNYSLFVFTISFSGIAVVHLIVGARGSEDTHIFFKSFSMFSLFLAAMGGIIVTLMPESFPIYTFVGFIRDNREIFAVCWFLLLFAPAAYLVSPKGIHSGIALPYFTFGSILALIIAVKSMLIPNWDIAYICFLTGIFGLFLAWWIESKLVLSFLRLNYLFLAFLWVAFVVLLSFVTLDIYGKQSNRQAADRLRASLDEVSDNLTTLFNDRDAVLRSHAGKSSLLQVINTSNGESAVSEAKDIYDQLGNVSRVIIYESKGIAIGVYPRNSFEQGANFSSREYFQKTVTGKKAYIFGTYMSILNTPAVMQTEPVFENNEVVGVIGVATNPDNFAEALNLKQKDYGVYVQDSKGDIVVNTSQENDGVKAENFYPLVDQKTNQITLTRQINNPEWRISVKNLANVTPDNISTLATGLIVMVVLNSLFSVFVGVQISKVKQEKELSASGMPFGDNPNRVATT
jgi:excisionase family DNA binding protein